MQQVNESTTPILEMYNGVLICRAKPRTKRILVCSDGQVRLQYQMSVTQCL